jgi:hypothetical protein
MLVRPFLDAPLSHVGFPPKDAPGERMAGHTANKPIWIWALAACWIVAIAAAIGGLASYMSGPQPTGEPGRRGVEVLAYTAGYCAGLALTAGAVIWALFAWLVFLKRASIGKTLLVLPIMVVVAFCVAAPVRLLAMTGRVAERTDDINAWAAAGGDRLRQVTYDTDRQLMEIGDTTVASMRSAEDIDDLVARSQRAEAIYADHQRRVQAEFARARGEIAGLRLTDEEAASLLEHFEERSFAPVTRFAEMNAEAARQRTAMMQLLQANRSKWVLHNGQVIFYDHALMTEMQARAEAHDRLTADIEARRLAFSQAGSAPQPLQ